MSHESTDAQLKLSRCDLSECEGRCCYDGVYLLPAEEKFLRDLVARLPELRAKLPAQFIVDGHWNGAYFGRKTATRAHEYRSADFPAHFTRTRCVFADEAGLCELEKFARENGQHPWTFKPTTCWMFPLQDDDGEPAEPVRGAEDDPYRTGDYAGYASCVPCGRHDQHGQPWRETLQQEIDYLQQARQLPLLGSRGHTVDELLARIERIKKTPPEAGL
ncbi:MAG TPA: DUF3109 family protein [Steroidobacteraceae bacterium]|nr:DUF3109 family protein [Steroidobacteraceae bacterium]